MNKGKSKLRGQSSRGASNRGAFSNRGRGKNSTPQRLTHLKEYLLNEANQNEERSSNKKIFMKDLVETDIKYFDVKEREEILPVEIEDLPWRNDPSYIMQKYLGQYPSLEFKSRMYYVTILEHTDSVKIKSFYRNNNARLGIISFSKCAINKILNLIDWGTDASKARAFKHNDILYQYNYWDCINAWRNAFYYENPKKKHSWFFQFGKEFFVNSKTIPLWFYKWWKNFGPQPSFLPFEIKEKYEPWMETHPFLQSQEKLIVGQCVLYFLAEFTIPWIWKWGITVGYNEIDIPVLYRTFHIRWWAQWPIQETIEAIETKLEQCRLVQCSKSEVKSTAAMIDLIKVKTHMEKLFPSLSQEEIMVKCVEHLKTQFRATFRKSLCQDRICNASNEEELARESQDPNLSLEDYWDAIIDSAKIIAKGKGKME